jgi:hypothetical protein
LIKAGIKKSAPEKTRKKAETPKKTKKVETSPQKTETEKKKRTDYETFQLAFKRFKESHRKLSIKAGSGTELWRNIKEQVKDGSFKATIKGFTELFHSEFINSDEE